MSMLVRLMSHTPDYFYNSILEEPLRYLTSDKKGYIKFGAFAAILLPLAMIGTLINPQDAKAEAPYNYPAGNYKGDMYARFIAGCCASYDDAANVNFSFKVNDKKKIVEGSGEGTYAGSEWGLQDGCPTIYYSFDISFKVTGTVRDDGTALLKFTQFSPASYQTETVMCTDSEGNTFGISDNWNIKPYFSDFVIDLKNGATYTDDHPSAYRSTAHVEVTLNRDQKIEVRATGIDGIADLSGASHLFIIYTDDNNQPSLWRAGPYPGCEQKLLPKPHIVCGNIWSIYHQKYYKGINDADGSSDWDTSASSVLLYSGKDLSSIISCFDSESQRINSEHVGYRPGGPNSNTFVHTLLAHCGTTIKKPNVWTPGWGNPLL